eukprot:3760651-Pyramimonas_sp.AAC.1
MQNMSAFWTCQLCGKPANTMCSGCAAFSYCGRRHQCEGASWANFVLRDLTNHIVSSQRRFYIGNYSTTRSAVASPNRWNKPRYITILGLAYVTLEANYEVVSICVD